MSSDFSLNYFLIMYLNDQLEYHATYLSCVPSDNCDPYFPTSQVLTKLGSIKSPLSLCPRGIQPLESFYRRAASDRNEMGYLFLP